MPSILISAKILHHVLAHQLLEMRKGGSQWERREVLFPPKAFTFLYSPSTSAPGITHHPIEWVPETFFLGVKTTEA
jgi:hypothetical protein